MGVKLRKILLSNKARRSSLSFNLEFKRNLEVKFDFKPALSKSFLCCHGIEPCANLNLRKTCFERSAAPGVSRLQGINIQLTDLKL